MNAIDMTWNKDGEVYKLLFHYVSRSETATLIKESGNMKAKSNSFQSQGYMLNGAYTKPRVNFTDIPPEAGVNTLVDILAATYLTERDINYCLELGVPISELHKDFDALPNAYQIYRQNDGDMVPVKVLRVWDMANVKKKLRNGEHIIRSNQENLPPLAWYEKR